MRKIIAGIITAMTVTVTASAIDTEQMKDFNSISCKALYAQGLFNYTAIFEKGSSENNNLAQTQAGMMSLMMFNTCVMQKQNIALQTKLDDVIVELQAIQRAVNSGSSSSSDNIVNTPSTSKGFSFDTTGDYE